MFLLPWPWGSTRRTAFPAGSGASKATSTGYSTIGSAPKQLHGGQTQRRNPLRGSLTVVCESKFANGVERGSGSGVAFLHGRAKVPVAGPSTSFAKMLNRFSGGGQRTSEVRRTHRRAAWVLSLLLSAMPLCHAQITTPADPAAAQPEADPAAQSPAATEFLPQPSASAQSSQAGNGGAALPGIATFAGSKVTGIRFDGVKQAMLGPLPAQLELQPGSVLTENNVRASLRRLYDSGLHDTIQVQGLRSEGGGLGI